MTDEPQQCDEYAENLAELALGILTGRARAATLAHVDSCAHCAEELEQLSRAADAVVSVAPELEPPVGFEVRLFNRMGLADDPAPVTHHPRPQTPWASAPGGRCSPLGPGQCRRGGRPPRRPQHRVVDRLPFGHRASHASCDRGGHGRPEGARQHGGERRHLRRFRAVDDRDPGRLVGRRAGSPARSSPTTA